MIDKFAGYGFNKSHAAAYALLAYQTAWLKAHHPHEFYAASMCYDMALTDKLAIFVDDARRLGVTMLPPCINASQAEFDVEAHEDGLAVRYALGALKSVGEGAMEKLVVERQAGGAFASLDALAKRVDPRLMNKRQLETLASAGAFDGIEPNRAGVHAVAETSSPSPRAPMRGGPADRAGCSARPRWRAMRSSCRPAPAGPCRSGWSRKRRRSASISRRIRRPPRAYRQDARRADLYLADRPDHPR